MSVTLTPHQQDALTWLVMHIRDATPLVALRGLAGTGKTTLVPALRAALLGHDITSVVGSPTHRAAMILRRKGIEDATTVHEHALMPRFKADYRRALAWLGDRPSTTRIEMPDPEDVPREDVDGLPWLVYERVKPDLDKARAVRRLVGTVSAKKLLASLGINGKHYFNGFGPKQGEGVLIIDEASMVGRKMLDLCQQAYQQIILIGDPGQLPPVKDDAVLASVPGVDLTEIHRQASDSPIIQLAYRARQSEPFWQDRFASHGPVMATQSADAAAFLEAPLIVWRNVTRITCTHEIRHALGYEKQQLYPGEPLVCRSTSQEDRVEGFYNNGLYRLVEISPDDPRQVTVEDALGETSTIDVHIEEIDGEDIPYKAIPFRFGYCLTAHTAQGGEWPTVYVSMPDLLKYAGFCMARDAQRQAELAQWTYTAITRAKDVLYFLTTHHFEGNVMPAKPVSPPSAPMMTTEPDDQQSLLAPAPALEDIPDPAVPASVQAAVTPPTLPDKFGEHEALLQGFAQHLLHRIEQGLNHEFGYYAKDAGKAVDDMAAYFRQQVEIDKDKLRHAETLLDMLISKAIQEGLRVRHDPYQASVQAISPQGFPVTITVTKPSDGELLTDLREFVMWLHESGFAAMPAPAAAVL
jgi:exodeoxyribonuclease-5